MNTVPAPAPVSATQISPRVYPAAGTPLAKVIGDPAHRESFHKQLQCNCLEAADFSPMIEHVIFVRFTERSGKR